MERKGWIESSSGEELAADPQSPYRMCFESGERFALSTLDAIRAQKAGMEYRAVIRSLDLVESTRKEGTR